MKLPRDLNGADLVAALRRLGYRQTRQTGSHVRMTLSFPRQAQSCGTSCPCDPGGDARSNYQGRRDSPGHDCGGHPWKDSVGRHGTLRIKAPRKFPHAVLGRSAGFSHQPDDPNRLTVFSPPSEILDCHGLEFGSSHTSTPHPRMATRSPLKSSQQALPLPRDTSSPLSVE